MSLRAKSKFVPASKPAGHAGALLFCSADAVPCHWARLVLAEKDVESARVIYEQPERPSEDLLVLNPGRTLPTLADRDTVIYPARVIAEYLDERFPHPPMMPPEPAMRANLRMVMDRLEQDFFPLAAVMAAGDGGRAARVQCFAQLSMVARLFPARGWFLGLDYSIVDCAWGALLWRLQQIGAGFPADAESIQKYATRVFARPAFQRSLAPAY